MDNFQIGSTPIDDQIECSLKFHQYDIYNSVLWQNDGLLCWDRTAKNIVVKTYSEVKTILDNIPPPPIQNEILIEPTPVNSAKNIYDPLKKKPVYNRFK